MWMQIASGKLLNLAQCSIIEARNTRNGVQIIAHGGGNIHVLRGAESIEEATDIVRRLNDRLNRTGAAPR